jgi:hypothetical protein
MRYTHLYTDEDGAARFEDVDLDVSPTEPTLSFGERFPVSSLFFATAAPGRRRAQAPEPRRNWVLCLTGSFEITASGETREFSPGDLLLAEDVDGDGHLSFTSEGYTVATVVL